MRPLEQLFAHEIEFFRRLRETAPGETQITAPHTSYALQHGYESLLRAVRPAKEQDLAATRSRLSGQCDARDIRSACASLRKMLDLEG